VKKGKFRVLTVRTAEADCIACVKGKFNNLIGLLVAKESSTVSQDKQLLKLIATTTAAMTTTLGRTSPSQSRQSIQLLGGQQLPVSCVN